MIIRSTLSIVCSIGFFDGVHRGHQCLIRQVLDEARRRDARSLLITFDRHPRSVFAPDNAPRLLTSAEEKMELLRATGVDDIYVLPFNQAMAALTAREFMEQVLKKQLGVDALVIGYDHHFGRPQGESFEDYCTFGREVGIEVVRAVELEGQHVSSSVIRRALEMGNVVLATQLLGRPYAWSGRVVHGHAVGRQLGFPTANLEATEPEKLLPARGAYAVRVQSAECEVRGAMLNIGHRPTLDNGSDTSVEAHVLDFRGDLYGHALTLFFIARLREERRFVDEAALAAQLQQDREAARAILLTNE
ncbi:MAG: bifunctional riboflavin kinase/FAD synthetase [Bacteroidaceae bacterium]|nr:bifunctional riboflavin kinase/FAD synthetase [Bacteroidaceae bacterium]